MFNNSHTLRPLLILWHPNYYNFKHLQKSKDGMVLGRHSTSTRAFRLRKKRGSFRLRKKDMNYIPLSYLDTYYALGKQRSFPYYESSAGLPRPPIEYHNRTPDDDMIEQGKRASFRLKKIPKNSGQIWSEPRSAKRASFRLKRILDSYKDLLGSPSGSATRLPHLIIYYSINKKENLPFQTIQTDIYLFFIGSSSTSAFRLRKRDGLSSFRLKKASFRLKR